MAIDMPPVTPVTEQCIIRSAESMGVPLPLLAAILYVENGAPGQAVKNKNGSYDLGPSQVNTLWLQHFADRGIRPLTLRNNGCVNVLAGASILRSEIISTKDYTKGVAQYHSRTPKYQRRYLGLINKAMTKFKNGFTLKQLVNRLNRRRG
jgi:hypothetical protein